MASQMAETFMQTLQQIEQSKDPAPLVALFKDNAEVSNIALNEPLHGSEGVREFWEKYLEQFQQIRSTFNQVLEQQTDSGGHIVLEWQSEGTLRQGAPIKYRGASILEITGDRVLRFRSYYDSAAFIKLQSASA
jgi:ketosteroid isomerase-like protein